ncbi:MAG: FAD-dependent thymidylate synthase [Terriglobales bacterium]
MSEILAPAPAQKNEKTAEKVPAASTNVFAVYGVEPEVQAYAMAKYSRSALSMRESLKEINDQKAEKFLNTFYFQYGHRSIADLAHIAFAIEKLSMIAAIILVDEQRWDGQERSTRYQDFKKSGYFTPDFGGEAAALELYHETIKNLFAEYEAISEGMFRWLEDRTPKPEEMKQDQYDRTLRARAFDISRYMLPLATNTSLGEIVNARTLETQISRLLASPFREVQTLGALLKDAARNPSVNINQEKWADLVAQVRELNADLGERAAQALLKEVRVSPTLVKYAEPNHYEIETRREFQHAARELMAGAAIAKAPLVDLLEDDALEVELATTLLYQHSHYSYHQIRDKVSGLSGSRVHELVALGTKHRGRHDELLRAFSAGQRLKFDILMDVGGFRDMHRHRRCTQICQDFTAAHGFDTPEDLVSAGLGSRYEKVMKNAADVSVKLAASGSDGAAHNALYVLPMGYRCRALFKMDFAEALYISELRTTAAGHFSYRNVAYAMYEKVAERYPALAKHFRVTDVRKPVNLLQR